MDDALAIEPGERDPDAATVNAIRIPYRPRRHFQALHRSTKRWKFVVAHRRAGKSVSCINEIIKRALENKREFPRPRYAYVGPSFAQTKDLIWGYLKHYAGVIPGTSFSESELTCTLPNGATITLYGGAAAYERMRGLYFDGIVLDEFSLLNPSVFSTVVRPCLADYRGWAIISGTSNGDDHFHELKKKNSHDPTWDFFIIPVNETDALHPDEVQEMTKDMTPEEYAREMLCSFDAPVEGAYYAHMMNAAELEGRVTGVPYDPAAPVFTWWDLGIDDFTGVWFVQKCGGELHWIDYYETTNKSLAEIMQAIHGVWIDPFKPTHLEGEQKGNANMPYQPRQKYAFGAHVLPHDVKARELGTGKSRYEVLTGLTNGVPVIVAPSLSVEDGIEAVKTILPISYWDKERTEDGRAALRNYHRSKAGRPVHNWASHGADAARYGAVALNMTIGYISSSNVTTLRGRLRRRIRGMV